ncbi:MAG: NAD-dependent epimerase/dehydratase family protein [Mizugakiibacter sp.]|uniref:NAD-dependent epimerase/dehydratase family protein n=1 Tax=Mizugakiibacter sp. TaxID=1972610 RepID=UPI0031BDA036|nr:NAD-dependent epimerase/dehydratase family protein [Xanthomonadaceae bacterium]
MQRVLIAGCGDVGARLAARLVARGDAVWGLRRSARALPPGVRPLRADLADPATLRALPGGITQLVYAATPDVREEAAYRRTFLDGPRRLLAALDTAALARVVFVSSSAVYGEHGGAWVDEATPPDPPGFNGRVLLEAEAWLAAQHWPATALRLAGLYGPGRTRLLEEIRAGRARAPRDPPFWANRIHVDDAAAALALLLKLPAPAPIYLGVDDTPLPLSELYATLAGRLGAPPPAEGPPPAGIGSKRLANARLRAAGFVPYWPDARAGYAALIAPTGAPPAGA